jgi:hypothetical protein
MNYFCLHAVSTKYAVALRNNNKGKSLDIFANLRNMQEQNSGGEKDGMSWKKRAYSSLV